MTTILRLGIRLPGRARMRLPGGRQAQPGGAAGRNSTKGTQP